VALTIRLLGSPAIERDGRPATPPRGRKGWALLAYLLLADRPPGRQHLAELLFGAADDPLGALRWTLADLRRALGTPHLLRGDPVDTALGDDVRVDVHAPVGEMADLAALLDLGSELLEGINVQASPEFESWLVVERHRLSAAVVARLRHAAVSLLAAGRAEAAVAYASQAVARDPLDEGNHVLLVRSLATAGDRATALRQVAVCEDTLRRELGIAPSAALREAAAEHTGSSAGLPVSGRAAAASQLEAGRAAIVAGAVEAGIDCLRRAAAEAASCGAADLRGRAMAALGSALIHSVRGRDEEGVVLLHEAILFAERAGDRGTAVTAHRELGFVEVQAGRRATADTFLATAGELAETDDEIAAVLAMRGMNASDMGDYRVAFGYLHESIERAAKCSGHRQQAWSLSILARAHLLRGEHSQAGWALDDALTLVRQQRWMAFLPWPQSFKAELDLRAGRTERAADELEHAWALACQLGDPCWEGVAARGLGLLNQDRGDPAAAAAWFAEALARCSQVSDRYQWVHAYVLDAMIGAALDQGDQTRASRLVDVLVTLAARCDLRELVVRAHVHRHRLGDAAALPAARLLATDIDNPALRRLLDDAQPAMERA
jgi:DNA-binding SARP family transcriptional activator